MAAREDILNIALNLFAEEGYENIGVARIVADAGVTKPTLYHHYGNKDGLLRSIIEVYGKALSDVFDVSLVYEGDVNGALDRLVLAYVTYAKEHPVFFILYKQLYQSPTGSDSYRIIEPFYADVQKRVESFFGQVANHHTNLKGKEAWMSFSLLGLMDTYILHHMRREDIDTLSHDTCRQVAKQFLHGVFA